MAIGLTVTLPRPASGGEADWMIQHAAQISTFAGYRNHAGGEIVGVMALPSLTADLTVTTASNTLVFGGHAAVRADTWASGFTSARGATQRISDSTVDPYRVYFRVAANQAELRVGLQQINFGSAKLLRPLRWFDTLNPTDALHLSEGVRAGLFRYTSVSNTSVWLWALIGNGKPRGAEFAPSDPDRPELGGRVQGSILGGELAITAHHRMIDITAWNNQPSTVFPKDATDGTDDRLGIDGTWDLGVGFWVEAYGGRTALDRDTALWDGQGEIGMDYTFLNGIHVLGEHLVRRLGTTIDKPEFIYNVSAATADYAVNLVDSVSATAFLDWTTRKPSFIASWLRTLDDWQIEVRGFDQQIEVGSFSVLGRGVELRLTYDYDVVM